MSFLFLAYYTYLLNPWSSWLLFPEFIPIFSHSSKKVWKEEKSLYSSMKYVIGWICDSSSLNRKLNFKVSSHEGLCFSVMIESLSVPSPVFTSFVTTKKVLKHLYKNKRSFRSLFWDTNLIIYFYWGICKN